MPEQQDIEALQAKLEELEARNRELQAKTDAGRNTTNRGRKILSAVLIVSSVILAPLATVGTWTRTMLVDTDRFVATFAPLAEDPAVQKFVADQALNAIEENVDIDGIVDDVFTGISSLNLPPRAKEMLPLLATPAADGIRSILSTGINRIVTSEQFAQIWEGTLRETHSRAVAIIQGDPNRAVQLTDDGTITLSLGKVISEVKQVLVDQGFGFAENIPEINRTIPLFSAESLTLVRLLYQLATAFGYWMPWIALGMLALGVALASNRVKALTRAAFALTVVFLLMSLGINVGSHLFAASVSPSIMPAATAFALYGQLTLLMASTLVALTALSFVVTLGAWFAGDSRTAHFLKRASTTMFSGIRTSAERHGLTTGKFGETVGRFSTVITISAVVVGLFVLFLNRPISLSAVITTTVVVLLMMLLVQLVRRPFTVDSTEVLESAEVVESTEPASPASAK